MTAALPEAVRKTPESVALDGPPRSGWRRSHKGAAVGAAGGGGLGAGRAGVKEI